MALTTSAALIAAGLSISALLGSKSAHTEIDIPAPPAQVWQVLTDIQNYQHWNPAIHLIHGELQVGNKVSYKFYETADNAAEISSEVIAIEENKLLNHKGGIWGAITFDQKYHLEASETGTRFIIHEDYTGISVNFWDPANTQRQYENMAKALKKRVIELN